MLGHGGSQIIGKSGFCSGQIDEDHQSEIVAVHITGGGGANNTSLVIGSFYRQPPHRDPNHSRQLCASVDRDNQNASFWMAGDANLPDIDWDTDTIT